MKIYIEKTHILIISDKLSTVLSTLTGFNGKGEGKRAMGFAIFPCFIILRNLTHPMTKQWINHESIHVRQFIESLGIFYILSMLEYLYYRIFRGYSHLKAYRYEAVEQEAYLNQHNLDYLSQKPFFSTLKYFKNKIEFYTNSEYQVVI